MRKALVAIALMSSVMSQACGWDYNEFAMFYSIFDQTNIADRALHPFLRINSQTYYTSYEPSVNENHRLWSELLPGWSNDEISQGLSGPERDWGAGVWEGARSKEEKAAWKYMEFAKHCSKVLAYRGDYSWDYDEIRQADGVDVKPELEQGMDAFHAEKNKSLKLRYAYQVIRLMHYSGQSQEAIDFFEGRVQKKFDKDEIYYYTLDQAGGCYYNLARFDEAALAFLEVFSESRDRKESAGLSLGWSWREGSDIEGLARNSGLEAAFITWQTYHDFDDQIDGLRRLVQLDPEDTRVELLFMRALNDLERAAWPDPNFENFKSYPSLTAEQLGKAREIKEISQGLMQSAPEERKDFWQLATSYVSFIAGDRLAAWKHLDAVTSKELKGQTRILKNVYTVFSWDKMNHERENELAGMVQGLSVSVDLYGDGDMYNGWNNLIGDQVAHLYLKEKQYAKAFLVHNGCSYLTAMSSLDLMESLIAFVKEENHSQFDARLISNISNANSPQSALDFLLATKGQILLQQGDAKGALNDFNALQDPDYFGSIRDVKGTVVPKKVFSNNILECFNCPSEAIMEDSVFTADLFQFIPEEMSMRQLAESLIQLEDLTKSTVNWKAKLAHYLLGNYYFNVDNTGYYRGRLSDRSNCCNYSFLGSPYAQEAPEFASDIIVEGSRFNLKGIIEYEDYFYEFAPISIRHYMACMDLSEDKELNARCQYLIAKSEANLGYNYDEIEDVYWGNKFVFQELSDGYLAAFEDLKTHEDTEFYKRIIEECSYFRFYVSNY